MSAKAYTQTRTVLGRGTFGTVYKGYNSDGKAVAIKVYNSNVEKKMMKKEVELLKSIPDHVNLVKFYQYIEEKKNYIVILEFCNGKSLDDYIHTKLRNNLGLPVEMLHKAIRDISSGYAELRKLKVAHRDIKPDNIMISEEAAGIKCFKISDLGCGKMVSDEPSSKSEELVSIYGAPDFMDPGVLERYVELNKQKYFPEKNKKAFNKNIDLWGIGCTFFEVACNRHPFVVLMSKSMFDDRIALYEGREDGDIMGTSIKSELTYSKDFRVSSPVNRETSSRVKDTYRKIISGCFLRDIENKYKHYEKGIDIIRDTGLCYRIELETGVGYYDFDNEHTSFEKCVFVSSLSELAEVKRPGVRLLFVYDNKSEVNIPNADFKIVGRDNDIITTREEIMSLCKTTRSILNIIEKEFFDIDMLMHLYSLSADPSQSRIQSNLEESFKSIRKVYKQCREDYLYARLVFDDFNCRNDAYRDLKKVQPQLKNGCQKVSDNCKRHAKEFRRLVYVNAGDENKTFKQTLCHELLQVRDNITKLDSP